MLNTLIPIVEEAGRLALSHFRSLAPEEIAEKNHLDLVTVADRAVEELLGTRLRAAFPGDGIYGEEGSNAPGTTGRTWVIDPIDGTFNFVRGRNEWAISVGLHEDGQPVLGAVLQPALGRLMTGGRDVAPCLNGRPLPPLAPFNPAIASLQLGSGGAKPLRDPVETMAQITKQARMKVRMTNASTAAMIEVLTGEVDGYFSCGDCSWDLMGTWAAAIALGAESTLDWGALPLDRKHTLLIGKPGVVAACRAAGIIH